ncbi:MAG: isoprenylcysteine carboxylmethyltransferase family protein [Deltaproteobacteria bacterium]|nr:isoprenylcysteine carboxylmethyltransferase family protein [Deltaproteobacteria bacterium]
MSTPARWATLVYGVLCYLAFHVSFIWLVLFLNDVPIVPTINSGASRPWAIAIAINLGLVLLFGLQHSVMARRSFKQAWTKVIPEPAERPTFVLATVACLIAAYVFWSPMTTEIWSVDRPAAVYTILGVQAVGWLTLVGSTFALNHFHLFGLTQTWSAFRNRPVPDLEFRMPWIYRVVRHPIQLGILIGVWAAPVMTVGHCVFAAAMTVYMFVGLFFEERDLVRQFGQRYLTYRQSVPKVIPRLWPSASSAKQHNAPPEVTELIRENQLNR